MMLSALPVANWTFSMLRRRSVPSSESSTTWETMTCPSAVAEKAYSPRPPWYFAMSMSGTASAFAVVISRTIRSWPGLISPENILAASVVMLLWVSRMAPVPPSGPTFAWTPMRTFSHLSPSMMSSPPLAHDGVAAVAAEDDVAGSEGGDAGSKHFLQPGDESDAFGIERAAEDSRSVPPGASAEHGRRHIVGALQHVVEAACPTGLPSTRIRRARRSAAAPAPRRR